MTVSDSLNGTQAEKIVAGDRAYAPYFLGMFLNGAYQEIMGNLHNLFGDTNAVHIHLTPQGYTIEHVVKGDTVNEVLGYVQYDVDDLIESMRRQTETAVQESQLTVKESQRLLQNYERSLRGYTYLNSYFNKSKTEVPGKDLETIRNLHQRSRLLPLRAVCWANPLDLGRDRHTQIPTPSSETSAHAHCWIIPHTPPQTFRRQL